MQTEHCTPYRCDALSRKVALEIFDMCGNYNVGDASGLGWVGLGWVGSEVSVSVCRFVSDALNFELCL